MCYLYCFFCPLCEKKSLVRGLPKSVCKNPRCVRLLYDPNPLAPPHKPVNEPCHWSCPSEQCGIRFLHYFCFDSCFYKYQENREGLERQGECV